MAPHAPPSSPRAALSRWLLLLFVLWTLLAVRIGFAAYRHESVRDDLALPLVAFFCASALLANWAWWKLTRKGRS